jgi:hypothetical protein
MGIVLTGTSISKNGVLRVCSVLAEALGVSFVERACSFRGGACVVASDFTRENPSSSNGTETTAPMERLVVDGNPCRGNLRSSRVKIGNPANTPPPRVCPSSSPALGFKKLRRGAWN